MPDLNTLQAWLSAHTAPRQLFVLADAATDSRLVHSLKLAGHPWEALLEQQGSAIATQGPHLFQIENTAELKDSTTHALRYAPPAAFTVLCAFASLPQLHSHLQSLTSAELEGGLKMGFAFWDPAILGTLVGQKDDATLHIAGPVLDPPQLQALLHPISAWWYWDRENQAHRIDPPPFAAPSAEQAQPLQLTQEQENQLVEASVPDQILYHLELNQPHLFDSQLPAARRYRFIRAVLGPARELSLNSMRDLVNFIALCLIYRQRMQTDPDIASLLDQVRLRQLTLDQAMELMPE